MAVQAAVCDFGWSAPDFALPATDGRVWSLAECAGANGTLVMFICNHCPYVLAILPNLIRAVQDMQAMAIGVVAINANDAVSHPADSFANMARLASEHRFTFPYLHDENQAVAKAYGAVCTPDFFGFNASLALQYRGRLDASGRNPAPEDSPRELVDAMRLVAETGDGPRVQTPSMGCSIKWRS